MQFYTSNSSYKESKNEKKEKWKERNAFNWNLYLSAFLEMDLPRAYTRSFQFHLCE